MPMACPAHARFQPVWVDDVARAFVAALTTPASVGQRYELVGPKAYSLRELVRYVDDPAGDRHAIIGLPGFVVIAARRRVGPFARQGADHGQRALNVGGQRETTLRGLRSPAPRCAGDIAPTHLGRVASFDEFALARERPGTDAVLLPLAFETTVAGRGWMVRFG